MNGGDLTRSTYRAYRHYSGVRMQQGRVQLDADWNEQLDATQHRDRAEALDVIGAAGVPKVDGGFELSVAPDGSDLLISPGRAWVAGHLCEADGSSTAVADTPTTTSVELDSLVLDGRQLAPATWVEVVGASGSVVARATAVDAHTRTVSLDTSIGGLTGDLRLRRRSSYATQPDLPVPDHTQQSSSTVPRVLDVEPGSYLAYLDVWDRTITALDDPTISEPALGVDTATRSQVVWQVRLLDLTGVAEPVDCRSDLSSALGALAPPTGLMAAQAEAPAGSADLCRPTPAGGYVGLANQLYRVHVHDLDAGRPVILWSRENASVVTAWLSTIDSDTLEVAGIGKDDVLGFGPGDWVELYDDTCVLDARPGTLARLLNAREDRLILDPATVTGSTDIKDFPRNPQVRRWDSPGPVTVADDGWKGLENGVQVSFPTGGTYRRHDYWLVPARSVLADVDWPRDSEDHAVALPPDGIRHDLGRLAIVTRSDSGLDVTDCRDLFPSLTTLTAEDVTVSNDACELPGVETVQDAIDVLCRSNDLRRHNRLLHGFGIVCGLAVHCGDGADTEDEVVKESGRFSTVERRSIFRGRDVADLEGSDLEARIKRGRLDLGELREIALRRFVVVEPGAAIDADGYDLELDEPVVVDVLKEVEGLGDEVLDEDGDGEICLVLRTDPERGTVVAATRYVAGESWDWLRGTLLHDIYEDCIAKPFRWVKAQLTTSKGGSAEEEQRAFLLRTALTNLLTYVANPRSGGDVFVSENEHEQLARFYAGLKKRLRSESFCAMFDDARPYPDYPDSLRGIRTIAGTGMHARARMHPNGVEVWTTGGGTNPLQPSTVINRYSLTDERLIARLDPVSGKLLEPGDKGSSTAAPATDVAFSPDGKLVYVAVPTRDGNDTLFRVGVVQDVDVSWRAASTICGVKLVTLATTDADPDHVYAVGLKRTTAEGKAFSLREYTGAGIWRIPSKEVPDDLGPLASTAGLNTVGHLVISPRGEAVFTCGPAGKSAESYDRLVSMLVPEPAEQTEMTLDGSGQDDLALVLGTANIKGTSAWAVVGSGDDRQIAGFELASGSQQARVQVGGAGRLSMQAVNDRIVVTDANSSVARVLDTSAQEFRERLLLPVQVMPTSVTATLTEPRQVVVQNLVSNSLTAIEVDLVMGDELDLTPLVEYRRAAVEAFADLLGGLAQYLKDCLCDHVLVRCPPTLENKDLDLAAVSIRGGSVYKVCNFSRRRYVKSFPTVGYWLSLVPVLPALREAIGQACCAVLPEVFGTYSTAGHDEASDRVDATRMLRLLEVVQGEDPMTRLHNLDWGGLPSFMRGANSGDWAEAPSTVRAERAAAPAETAEPARERAGGDVARASAPELVFRNLLRNPAISRDLETRVEVQRTAAVEPEGLADQPRQLEALMARIDSLEAQVVDLKASQTPRTRKSTPKSES